MSVQLNLEKKHDLLKDRLNKDLQEMRALELRISGEFEELKKLEISIEKRHFTYLDSKES